MASDQRGRVAGHRRDPVQAAPPAGRRRRRADCDDLERFLTELSLGATVDALDPRPDAITLLTLHAAKGLEFEVVFVAGGEAGLLPLRFAGPGAGQPAGTETDTDEERRLLFLGMTRARSRLLISYAATRSWHGTAAPAGPSPFLQVLGPALVQQPVRARAPRPAQRQLRLL